MQMNRKNKGEMHIRDLYERASHGCTDSIDEIIDRQQDGRSLRFYPNGRKGADDEGMIGINMTIRNGSLVARSGRPRRATCMDQDITTQWIIGAAKCVDQLIEKNTEDDLTADEIRSLIDVHATPGFDVHVHTNYDEDRIEVTFLPLGATQWVLPVEGAAKFITRCLRASKELGWKMNAEPDEIDLIRSLTDSDYFD